MKRWTSDELETLRQHYVNRGARYCSVLVDRSVKSISLKANKLGLLSKIANGGSPKKQIINQLPNGRATALCDEHGPSEHYLYKGCIHHCVKCKLTKDRSRAKTESGRRIGREKSSRYRRTQMGLLDDRLRSSLNQGFKKYVDIVGTEKPMGCFRLLQYTPRELCSHLKAVGKLQNNQCPMCDQSYDSVLMSIDHIIPLRTARTKEKMLRLFDLCNLSLLCQPCNSSKGGKLCR